MKGTQKKIKMNGELIPKFQRIPHRILHDVQQSSVECQRTQQNNQQITNKKNKSIIGN